MVIRTSPQPTKLTLVHWIVLAGTVTVFVALVWGVWIGLSAIAPALGQWLEGFATLPPPLAAAIVGGLVSIIVSPLTVTLTKWWERKWLIEQEHRNRKRPVYERFMSFWFAVFSGNRPGGTPLSQAQIIESLNTFTRKLVVWGSPEVIRTYSEFRNKAVLAATLQSMTAISQEAVADAAIAHTAMVDALKSFEKLLFAIRADLGHNTKGLKERELLRLFVTDLDDAFDASPAEISDTVKDVETA